MKKKRPAVSVTHVEDGRRTPVPPPKRGKKGTGKRVLVFFITLLLCLVLFGLLGFFLLRDQLLAPDGATSAPVTTSQGTSRPLQPACNRLGRQGRRGLFLAAPVPGKPGQPDRDGPAGRDHD